jgi:outer membrane lipopolysaccharide assembly protein LptE/RlpB
LKTKGSGVRGQGSGANELVGKYYNRSKSGRVLSVFLLLLPFMLFLAGCGYHLVREEGIRGGDVKVVDVPMFKNKTFEPHTPGIFTEAFTRELVSSGFFQVNKPNPDSTLQGIIARVVILHSSLSGVGLVVEKTATVDVELTLTKNTGQVVRRWKLTESEPFRADDVNLQDFNKREALKRVAARMSRRFSALILADY